MSRKRRTKFAMGVAAVAGAMAMVLSQGVAANAAQSGTRTCGVQYGWLQARIANGGILLPPGSDRQTVLLDRTGTFNAIARYSNGQSKPGGGYWWADASTLYSATPSCSGAH